MSSLSLLQEYTSPGQALAAPSRRILSKWPRTESRSATMALFCAQPKSGLEMHNIEHKPRLHIIGHTSRPGTVWGSLLQFTLSKMLHVITMRQKQFPLLLFQCSFLRSTDTGTDQAGRPRQNEALLLHCLQYRSPVWSMANHRWPCPLFVKIIESSLTAPSLSLGCHHAHAQTLQCSGPFHYRHGHRRQKSNVFALAGECRHTFNSPRAMLQCPDRSSVVCP